MRVYVHRNLNKKCWSVLHRGRLLRYRNKILLHDVEFRVRPAGAARAQREKKRNVHAFAIGRPGRGFIYGAVIPVRYNVWEGKFVDETGREVLGAEKVYFNEWGEVRAYRPFRQRYQLEDRLWLKKP